MADTSKSIKNASNSELNAILYRLRSERDCLQLLREIQVTSTPNLNNAYPDWEKLGPFSTETIVYEGKSIKQMTDRELADYLDRLRNENELLNIIQNIQRFNKQGGTQLVKDSDPYPGVDLNSPIDNLYHEDVDKTLEHFGIPGMRWGVRKSRGRSSKASPSEDHSISRQIKKKKTKEMSNDELKKLTTRMNLERNLRDLKSSDYQKGLDFVKTLTAAGATVAGLYALSETPLGKAVVSGAKRKLKGG